MLEQVIYTDGGLDEDCLNLRFAELLEEAGPWGSNIQSLYLQEVLT